MRMRVVCFACLSKLCYPRLAKNYACSGFLFSSDSVTNQRGSEKEKEKEEKKTAEREGQQDQSRNTQEPPPRGGSAESRASVALKGV